MVCLEHEGTVAISVFWTDSLAVLHTIRNTHKQFHVFVANRLAQIIQNTSTDLWRFVFGKDNRADTGTRPCTTKELQSNWFFEHHFFHYLPSTGQSFQVCFRLCLTNSSVIKNIYFNSRGFIRQTLFQFLQLVHTEKDGGSYFETAMQTFAS